MKCPNCNQEMGPGWERCPFDGTELRKRNGEGDNKILWIIGIREILIFLIMTIASAFVFGALFILLVVALEHFGDSLDLIILSSKGFETFILMVILYPFSIALLTDYVSGLQTWLFRHSLTGVRCFLVRDFISLS